MQHRCCGAVVYAPVRVAALSPAASLPSGHSHALELQRENPGAKAPTKYMHFDLAVAHHGPPRSARRTWSPAGGGFCCHREESISPTKAGATRGLALTALAVSRRKYLPASPTPKSRSVWGLVASTLYSHVRWQHADGRNRLPCVLVHAVQSGVRRQRSIPPPPRQSGRKNARVIVRVKICRLIPSTFVHLYLKLLGG